MKEDQPKLLIIDDCQDILDALNKFFVKKGCEVFTALSGKEGLNLANLHEFTAVLIDIYMPEMGGEDTLIKMKKIHPSIPIIMITGFEDEEKAMKCMELGAYDYIKKPFDYKYLKTSVLSTALLNLPKEKLK